MQTSAPVTSVACERGFFTQNCLKTKARSRLDHNKLTKLIRIEEEGPSVWLEKEKKIKKKITYYDE
ncbi:hypothetical protein DPMN_091917 [Dreissena polymorpha]|uniref:HAT C-terminal dimerisation domain-containing protein n=1 Tax=Dreissena polymorpha TaxID=45954 RepID=A0A9D4L1E2_DREPO|nr:hypothetical protein DPMN_091917 [Dreissena polymorpha]